jgi:hypothetical protein
MSTGDVPSIQQTLTLTEIRFTNIPVPLHLGGLYLITAHEVVVVDVVLLFPVHPTSSLTYSVALEPTPGLAVPERREVLVPDLEDALAGWNVTHSLIKATVASLDPCKITKNTLVAADIFSQYWKNIISRKISSRSVTNI